MSEFSIWKFQETAQEGPAQETALIRLVHFWNDVFG